MLHATRYLRKGAEELALFVDRHLHKLSFEKALEFYADFHARGPAVEDVAFLAANDRYYLLRHILSVGKKIEHPWLYGRVREVEKDPDGYLDLWSRYHFKTTIITFAGTIEDVIRNPEVRVCIFSFNKQLAREQYLRNIKNEFEQNNLLKQLFPDVLYNEPEKEAPWWSEAGIVVKRKGNPREATVEAHGLIDAMPTGKHFDVLKYDDMLNEKHIGNAAIVRKIVMRWELSDSLGTGEGTRKQMVGTRYSYGDAYRELLDRKVVKPRLKAATKNGKADGEPVFLSEKEWARIKRDQRNVYPAQFLQNPTEGQNTTFQTSSLRGWWVRPRMLNVYIMGDGAGRPQQDRLTDRTAIAVIGIDAQMNKYLLDGFCHRMRLSERWERLEAMHRKWEAMPGVQNVMVGWERFSVDTDMDYFDEQMEKPGRKGFAIETLSWPREGGKSKSARIGRLDPDLTNGRFFVPAIVYHEDVRTQWRDRSGQIHTHDEDGTPLPEERHSYWYVDDDGLIQFPPAVGPTKMMQRESARGNEYLVAKPLIRKAEDGSLYDLSRVFFEEMSVHPFAQHDDFIDAVSRIYDMQPSAPKIFEAYAPISEVREKAWDA